jgi:hypothetical protein
MCLTNTVKFNVTVGFFEGDDDTQTDEAVVNLTENAGKAYLGIDGTMFLTAEDLQYLSIQLALHQKRIDVK